MKPLTVVTGIVLGTCLSIALGLAAVMLMFLILGGEHPRIDYEFPALLVSFAIFLGMTAVAALSFYSLLINHRGRLLAQAVLWLGVAATVYFYWP